VDQVDRSRKVSAQRASCTPTLITQRQHLVPPLHWTRLLQEHRWRMGHWPLAHHADWLGKKNSNSSKHLHQCMRARTTRRTVAMVRRPSEGRKAFRWPFTSSSQQRTRRAACTCRRRNQQTDKSWRHRVQRKSTLLLQHSKADTRVARRRQTSKLGKLCFLALRLFWTKTPALQRSHSLQACTRHQRHSWDAHR
jgi:hypothetical protein